MVDWTPNIWRIGGLILILLQFFDLNSTKYISVGILALILAELMDINSKQKIKQSKKK